jgi:hypothetical protein
MAMSYEKHTRMGGTVYSGTSGTVFSRIIREFNSQG